jgi:Carboxypeptidase regulatory-like domain
MPPPGAIILITCIAIGGLTAMPALAQPPGRDAARPAPTGTAAIDGVILTDDSDARPLRRVRVGVMTSDRQASQTTVTDDEGRFRFVGLPAGRFMLSASKQGYVTGFYGARRPNRPGTALVLADGQQMTGLSMRLTRGSVVSGVIVDQNGDPFAGGTVSAMRNAYTGSGRTLVQAASAQTDDRGHYRIWGLPAGDYVVSASTGFGSPIRDTEIARLTDADIKRALSEVAAGSTQPGGASTASSTSEPRARTVGYAPVFYPGTPVASQAMTIKLAVAEERTGVDFPLSLVATAKVEGHVVVPEGVNPRTLAMQMIGSNPQGMLLDVFRRGSVAADGSFSFAGVTPGPYAIVVQAMPAAPTTPAPPGGGRPGPAAGPPRQATHWARADVVLEGQDISGVTLTLQPGMVVAGRVQLEGTSAQPPDLSRIRINLLPVQAAGEVSLGQTQIQPDAAGSFRVTGVTPGRYRLMASIPSPRPDTVGWQLKSSVVHGQDTVDIPIDLREGTDNAVITFTDRVTELNGMIQDASGQPAPEYTVVVFARDKTLWTMQSRRVRTARPAADGRFVMPNLPPGDYLMTAVTDLEPGEQSDPAFLELLSRSAIAVMIGEGEKKTQDLRLAAQLP